MIIEVAEGAYFVQSYSKDTIVEPDWEALEETAQHYDCGHVEAIATDDDHAVMQPGSPVVPSASWTGHP